MYIMKKKIQILQRERENCKRIEVRYIKLQ